jgi:hypothetical protein
MLSLKEGVSTLFLDVHHSLKITAANLFIRAFVRPMKPNAALPALHPPTQHRQRS